jgi:DNA replication licensing factor MCM3
VILRYALYKEVFKRQKRKKRKLNAGGAREVDDTDDEEAGSEEEEEPPKRMSMPPPKPADKEVADGPRKDPIWGEDSQDAGMQLDPAPPAPTDDGGIRPERQASSLLYHSCY